MKSPTSDQPLLNHLVELRKCLLKVLAAVAVGFCVSLYFAKDIYNYLSFPLIKVLPQHSFFITTHPFEAWLTYLKTAFFAGLFMALPVIFWYIWQFVAPGLKKKEKLYSLGFVFFSSLLFMSGSVFGYFYAFPYVFDFFINLTQDTSIVFLPQMKDYLNFSFKLLLGFGLIFEMPVLIVFLSVMGVVSVHQLVSFRKYMLVVSFIIAAILTPPDVVTQMLMGIPMVLLYEIGIIVAKLLTKISQHSETL